MSFSANEQDELIAKLRDLVGVYAKVKKYVIAAEKASNGDRLSIPAINELRNTNDHLIRAFAVFFSIAPVPGAAKLNAYDYCRSNISKAIGHTYRAGYDALDIISLALVSDINSVVQGFAKTTLVTVFADYSNLIRKPLEKAIETVIKPRR